MFIWSWFFLVHQFIVYSYATSVFYSDLKAVNKNQGDTSNPCWLIAHSVTIWSYNHWKRRFTTDSWTCTGHSVPMVTWSWFGCLATCMHFILITVSCSHVIIICDFHSRLQNIISFHFRYGEWLLMRHWLSWNSMIKRAQK